MATKVCERCGATYRRGGWISTARWERRRYCSLPCAQQQGIFDPFWSHVRVGPGCWEWTAALGSRGYGQTRRHGKPIRAHRMAWELTNGPIPGGLHVLHHCDNPICVNPSHLFLGTPADNARDRPEKGRTRGRPHPGEDHGNAKLTEAKVREIRRLKAEGGWSDVALSRLFGVNPRHIASICRHEAWAHIA